jgi:hypothetical protein
MADRFLHVLLLREGQQWVLQALEVDLGAQGSTPELAEKAFLCALRAQAHVDVEHGRQPFEGFPQAPQVYWDAFANAPKFKTINVQLDEGLPPYMIQATTDQPVTIQ